MTVAASAQSWSAFSSEPKYFWGSFDTNAASPRWIVGTSTSYVAGLRVFDHGASLQEFDLGTVTTRVHFGQADLETREMIYDAINWRDKLKASGLPEYESFSNKPYTIFNEVTEWGYRERFDDELGPSYASAQDPDGASLYPYEIPSHDLAHVFNNTGHVVTLRQFTSETGYVEWESYVHEEINVSLPQSWGWNTNATKWELATPQNSYRVAMAKNGESGLIGGSDTEIFESYGVDSWGSNSPTHYGRRVIPLVSGTVTRSTRILQPGSQRTYEYETYTSANSVAVSYNTSNGWASPYGSFTVFNPVTAPPSNKTIRNTRNVRINYTLVIGRP